MNKLLKWSGIEITEKRKTLVALTMIPLMIAMGGWACNPQTTQNWVTNINTILAEVGPAVQIIVSLLPLLGAETVPGSVTSAINDWIPRVNADVAELEKLLGEVQSDLATNTTVQAKVNALIATTAKDVGDILPVFRVLDLARQQKITALVTAILAAVQSVMVIVTRIEGKVTARQAVPFTTNGADFKEKFNAVLHSPTTDKSVDTATAGLSLK